MARVFESGASSLPRNVFSTCPKANRVVAEPNEFSIKTISGTTLMIVKNAITLDHVKKAAKCAKFKQFVLTRPYSTVRIIDTQFPIKCNLIIHEIIRAVVPSVPEPRMISIKEHKIFGPDCTVIQVVKGGIEKKHLDKAAKCAGLKDYKISLYPKSGKMSVSSDMKLTHNVYLRKVITRRKSTTTNVPATKSAKIKSYIKESKQSLRDAFDNLTRLENLL